MRIKTPSVLAFTSNFSVSDGLLSAGLWTDRGDPSKFEGIKIRRQNLRGTISNRLPLATLKAAEKDPARLNQEVGKANLQMVDKAALPISADTLLLEFTVKVLPGVGQPNACNDRDYAAKLAERVRAYSAEHGFAELARRYAIRLASGYYLWRNRDAAEDVEVRITHRVHGEAVKVWCFDALNFELGAKVFDLSAQSAETVASIEELAAVIAGVLKADKGAAPAILEVQAYARLGRGQTVYPSQELGEEKVGDRPVSRLLYQLNNVAAFHSQKLGNSIRAIDTWYPNADAENRALAVEPYAQVTTEATAFRAPSSKQDFYSLLDDWMEKDKPLSVEQQHYVIAMLIRGGVFGKPDADKKKAAKSEAEVSDSKASE